MLHTLTVVIVLFALSFIAFPYSDSTPVPQPAGAASFATRHWLLPGQSVATDAARAGAVRYYRV